MHAIELTQERLTSINFSRVYMCMLAVVVVNSTWSSCFEEAAELKGLQSWRGCRAEGASPNLQIQAPWIVERGIKGRNALGGMQPVSCNNNNKLWPKRGRDKKKRLRTRYIWASSSPPFLKSCSRHWCCIVMPHSFSYASVLVSLIFSCPNIFATHLTLWIVLSLQHHRCFH